MPAEKSRSSSAVHVSGWRLWLARLAMVVGVPSLLFVTLEAGLRGFGYGSPTTFFVRSQDGANEAINPQFTTPFFPPDSTAQAWPVVLPAIKPPGTLRIFILGESAAHGTPDPSFGFARILEVMLRRQYPDRRFEIVNAARRGINSHLILPITRECAKREPDLFIIYMGNNEVTGLYAPEPGAWNVTPYLHLLRLMQRARATRSAQLFQAVLPHRRLASPETAQDMEFFRARRLAADDSRRLAITENFHENLRAICDTVLSSGAKAVVSTVVVNLHDCPPLASLHREDLRPADRVQWESLYAAGIEAETAGAHETAMARFVAAAQIDDHFADLHYRLARCHGATGQTADAREEYAAACDWDAMQFRTDRRLNGIVREVTENREAAGLFFVDAVQALSECPRSERGTPGARLFYEHVHLRFDGDYWIAKTLLPRVVLALALGAPAKSEPSRDECAAALAYNEWDELDMLTAVAEATARPPFLDQLDHAAQQARFEQLNRERLSHFGSDAILRTLAVCREAVLQAPDDWQLRYIYGRALYSFKAYAEAVDPLQNAVRLMPSFTPTRLMLADSLAKTGHPHEAARQLQEALRLDPQSSAARAALDQPSMQELPTKR